MIIVAPVLAPAFKSAPITLNWAAASLEDVPAVQKLGGVVPGGELAEYRVGGVATLSAGIVTVSVFLNEL